MLIDPKYNETSKLSNLDDIYRKIKYIARSTTEPVSGIISASFAYNKSSQLPRINSTRNRLAPSNTDNMAHVIKKLCAMYICSNIICFSQ